MKAIYVQTGENLDYRNNTELLIEAGDVVTLGSRIGVAGTAIFPGELGALHMVGVFLVPKKAGEAIAAGADLYYADDGFSASAGNAGTDTGSSETENAVEEAGTGAAQAAPAAVGYAVKEAAADDTNVLIKIR